jgi:hypothetical protein
MKILILTNSPSPQYHAGQLNGFELLVDSREIESVDSVSHVENYDKSSSFNRVLSALKHIKFDVVMIWTPKYFPSNRSQFDQLLSIIGKRPILYYEGDAWGHSLSKKPVSLQMKWWLEVSDRIFTTTSLSKNSNLGKYSSKKITFMPNTYCHFYFSECEKFLPPKYYKNEICLIGNNTSRLPMISGLPGSSRRLELAARLKISSNLDSQIFGSGWPFGWSKGPIEYGDQGDTIRSHRISLNWDHYPNHVDYSSDRLPISLIAGRPHITTRHPGMSWVPGEEIGLFQVGSPREGIEKVQELLQLDPEITWDMGLEAFKWSRFRMSHRAAARFIISSFDDSVKKIAQLPWANLY